MKIGFDAKRAFFNYSGLGNYSRDTIRILAEYFPDWEYFLYTPPVKEEKNQYSPHNTKIIEPEKWLHRSFPSYWRRLKLCSTLAKNQIDLFHGLSNEIPSGIEKTKIKSIVTIHDLIFMRFPKLYNKIDRKIYEKKSRTACEKSDTIIAISENTKQDICKYYSVDPKKIEVVYQGCNPQFYKKIPKEELDKISRKYNLPNQYILYVGTIEKRKNLAHIVEALSKSKDIHLVAIGRKTEYFNNVSKALEKHKLCDRFHYLDGVPFQEFPAIYQMAEIFIYPSSYEGFGIPIIEAMASGIPVITYDTAGTREAAGEAAVYCKPGQTENMADIINKLMNDAGFKKSQLEKANQHIRQFADEQIASRLGSVYKKTMEQ